MDKSFVPSTWRRLFARGVDQILCYLMYIPFAGGIVKVFLGSGPVYISLPELIFWFFVPAIYESIFLVLFQASPGKWLFGLKVVPSTDPTANLEFVQCILRPFINRFSFFFSWAIFALAFFRYDRTHLSDWVANTRVVQGEPRINRAALRPILGVLFVIIYFLEGIESSSSALQKIDWSGGRVDVRKLLEVDEFEELLRKYEIEEEV